MDAKTDLSNLLDKHFDTRDLHKGEYFIREGEYSNTIGYVESGLLHSYQIDESGESITTTFFQSGAFCGSYYSFYRKAPALDSIKAITSTRLHTIGFSSLKVLLDESLIINQISRQALEQVCIEKDIRLSKMLKLNAKERYMWFMREYPTLIEKAPLKYIASYLGMKPESLSRIRKELIS